MKKIYIVFFYSLLIFSCSVENNDDLPNFVFILADDLGYGEIGVLGQKRILTPNIDKLAKEGMILTNHYSGSPTCAGSRSVLLTGLHSGKTPIRGNDEWTERGDVWSFESMFNDYTLEGQRPMPDSIVTVATILKSNGYKTGMVGKWGLGAPHTNSIPNKKGFDFFYGYNCQRQAHTLYPSHLWRNTNREILNNEIVRKGKLTKDTDINDPETYSIYSQNDYAPTLMHKEAIDFIDRNRNNKFFLYYASPLPHLPLQAPLRWVQYYNKIFGDEEPYIGDNGYYPNLTPKATYAAMISYLDEQVGEIVLKLKEIGKFENTFIVFTSDNGPTHLRQVDIEFFKSSGKFQGSINSVKGNLNEAGIRVPTILSWPKKIKAGSSSDHISAFQDFYSTVLDITESSSPYPLDGISYYPLINGETQKEHDYLYWEFPSYGGQQAIRINQWKGIRKDLFNGNKKIKLYNLDYDILESNDLSNQYPDIINQMETYMKKARTEPFNSNFKIPIFD
ncbi:MAG: arylsulfatase [Bacteroidota bacterium]